MIDGSLMYCFYRACEGCRDVDNDVQYLHVVDEVVEWW